MYSSPYVHIAVATDRSGYMAEGNGGQAGGRADGQAGRQAGRQAVPRGQERSVVKAVVYTIYFYIMVAALPSDKVSRYTPSNIMYRGS